MTRRPAAAVKFASLEEIAERLVERLRGLPLRRAPAVVAVGEDGLPLAERLAALLAASLATSRVEHLVIPWYPRLPFGALSADNHHYIDPVIAGDHALGAREIAQICRERLPQLRGPGWRRPRPLGDVDAVVVAAALSTGYRALVTAASARAAGAGDVVIAAPCAARDALHRIAPPLRSAVLSVSDGPRFDPSDCLPAEGPAR